MRRLQRVTMRGLAQMAGTTEGRLRSLARRPDAHYRKWTHRGKNGKKRVLTIPNQELKRVQRCLLRNLLDPLRPHKAAACVRGKGAVWMMRRHQRHPFLLSLDVRNFFPSVNRSRISEGLTRLGLQHAELLSSLLTVNNELPQGAPTSVALGDIALFRLDSRIAGLARAEGLVYSRYVDDLAISGGSRIRDRFQRVIKRFAAEEGWRLNEKGGLFGPGDRHMVLGAVVNAKPNVSESYFNDVRSHLRLVERGSVRPTLEDLNRLGSRVAWISHVNPDRGPKLKARLKKAIDATRPK